MPTMNQIVFGGFFHNVDDGAVTIARLLYNMSEVHEDRIGLSRMLDFAGMPALCKFERSGMSAKPSMLSRAKRKAKRLLGDQLASANKHGGEKPSSNAASKAKPKDKNVRLVCKATGWSEQKAIEEMDHAVALGMSYYRYAHNEAWKLNDQQISKLAEKLERRAEVREKNIDIICDATGWDEDWTKSELKKASDLGITSSQYVRFSMYDLSGKELKEFASVLEERKQINASNTELYKGFLCQKTGWSKEKAEEKLAEAKEKGISAFKYLANSCYTRDGAGLDAVAALVKRDSERVGKDKDFYVSEISKATGWSRGKVELEVNKAKNLCGSSYEDYYAYKFYEITPEEQATYATFGLFSKMRFKYNNREKANALFDDKAAFNKTFSDLIHRRWFTNERGLTYEQFLEYIKGLTHVLVKPLAATQGIGIKKFACNESDEANKAFYDELMAMPACIIEKYIIQNKEVARFCDTSVNTVRLTTLNYNGECKFLYSVFRMGQGAVVDNFHAGGIAATVDMETGTVITSAADLHGNTFPIHPYSGLPVKGFKIPHWDQVLDVCRKATGRIPDVNLVGWDLAITEDGVDLVEGNPGASYIVAQIPCVEDRIGLRPVMIDPYL